MSLKKIIGFCGACIAFYIGAGFATMQEVMQYEASYGGQFWIVIVVAAAIYVYTNLSFVNNGNRVQLKRGGDIYQMYCGKWIGTFFDVFSALFCYMSFIVMCGGANSTCMEQWGLPNGAGAVILAAAAIVTVVFGLNGVVKALKFVGPVIILLIVFVSTWTAITGWDNLADGFAAIDVNKYQITQVGDGNPFASGASYGGFVILWFAAFLGELGAKNKVKEVNIGMLLSTIAIFGVAAVCCLALIGNLSVTWDAGVPALVLANSIHPAFGLAYAIIIFLGIYSSACPLLWTGVSRIAQDNNKNYKVWAIALGIVGCAIACFVPYRPLLNVIYGLNGYLGFVLVAFMIVNDMKVWKGKLCLNCIMDNLDFELKKHRFISFVEDHYNPLDVIRSLGEKGIRPIVILIGEHPVMIPHCRYVGTLHRVKSREEGYRLLMENYSDEEIKPFVFCSDDKTTSFLDQHYDEMKNYFYFYNAGEQGRVTDLQNKEIITTLGVKAGLTIPKSEVVDTGVLPKTLKYPILTKVLASTMGAWKNDVFICQNEDELREAYTKIKSPKLIVQEYINKVGEFCMEGFAINNGQDIFMPYSAEYIRFYNNSYGHYMNMVPFPDGEFKDQIKELFRLTKFNGIFEIEFMKGPDGKNYFLEINFRASTWNYALTVGGGNLPYYWAKSMLAGKVLLDEMTLREKPFKAIVEPSDFMRNVRKVGLFKWMVQCLGADCHYYFNIKDPLPFFSYTWNRIFGKHKVSEY